MALLLSLHPTTPQTVQSRRRALIACLRAARDEVSAAERAVDTMVERIANLELSGVGKRTIDLQVLRDANARLFLARTQQAELRAVLLDAAPGLDMEQQDDLGTAFHDAHDRIVSPRGYDENDEHRLSFVDLGLSARAL